LIARFISNLDNKNANNDYDNDFTGTENSNSDDATISDQIRNLSDLKKADLSEL
jgi:hypothetical protein